MIQIVFFYSRMAGYLEGVWRALLTSDHRVNIHVVFWDTSDAPPYQAGQYPRLTFYPRSAYTTPQLNDFLNQIKPDVIYIVGWMDKGYLQATHQYKKQTPEVVVVAGIDDQWKGSLRQHLGRVAFRLKLRSLFDYLWVAGKPQYHYARMMGYNNNRIIPCLLSANTYLFHTRAVFSKRIVFVGRFAREKGIFNLINTYKRLPEAIKAQWPLVLIGDGPLRSEIMALADVHLTIKPFMQAPELADELSKGGVFCLPSNLWEMWGVVIHEAALMGYPLLLSEICGANTEFLIEHYNGYSFQPNNAEDFYQKMLQLLSLPEEMLIQFGQRSHQLGQRINVEQAAHALLSVLPSRFHE